MSVPVQHPMYIDGQFVTWQVNSVDVVNPLRSYHFPHSQS